MVPRIRLQSHQVHPTVLTIIQQLCSMKQKHTNYTQAVVVSVLLYYCHREFRKF